MKKPSERLKANPNERASQFQTDQIDAVLKGRVLISNDITDLDQALIVIVERADISLSARPLSSAQNL
jgi:hypothetical protein